MRRALENTKCSHVWRACCWVKAFLWAWVQHQFLIWHDSLPDPQGLFRQRAGLSAGKWPVKWIEMETDGMIESTWVLHCRCSRLFDSKWACSVALAGSSSASQRATAAKHSPTICTCIWRSPAAWFSTDGAAREVKQTCLQIVTWTMRSINALTKGFGQAMTSLCTVIRFFD